MPSGPECIMWCLISDYFCWYSLFSASFMAPLLLHELQSVFQMLPKSTKASSTISINSANKGFSVFRGHYWVSLYFLRTQNYQNASFLTISEWTLHLIPCFSQHCSPLGSLPGVWTLFWPQGALPLRLSLPTSFRQQDLHVLLPPQQHGLQILLQRDWVPDGHADQPHHHLRWICTQVSNDTANFTLVNCSKHLGW